MRYFRRRRGDLRGRRVAVALRGGLGNQLYQWALGEALLERGADVVHLTATLNADVPVEIGPLVPAQRLVDGAVSGWKPVRQSVFGFDPVAVGDVADGVLLDGHWTSEHYFAAIAPRVRRRVLAWGDDELTADGRALRDELAADPTSCAVHVRRGDYVTNPRALAHHGSLDVAYYERAIDRARALGARRFYAFSDDLDWVAANLGHALTPVGREVGRSAIADVRLMAACGSRVVANSTFSWWGGWLAGPDAVTVAPTEWFAGTRRDLSGFVPRAWDRVPSFQDVTPTDA